MFVRVNKEKKVAASNCSHLPSYTPTNGCEQTAEASRGLARDALLNVVIVEAAVEVEGGAQVRKGALGEDLDEDSLVCATPRLSRAVQCRRVLSRLEYATEPIQ